MFLMTHVLLTHPGPYAVTGSDILMLHSARLSWREVLRARHQRHLVPISGPEFLFTVRVKPDLTGSLLVMLGKEPGVVECDVHGRVWGDLALLVEAK